METEIIERYARCGDGRFVIDVATRKIEELYDDFDRSAPYSKKDLKHDLVDFIVDSVEELGSEPFLIQFSVETAVETASTERVRLSIGKYFSYLQRLEHRKLKTMFQTSLILLGVGAVILTFLVGFNQRVEAEPTLMGKVFAEGLMVAAWVSLWEALATFLISWVPHRRKIRLYQRIINAEVLFRSGL